MKIAQIPPLYESVPPRFYGGTERIVAYLCDALVELGHEVTLFSTADAHTNARLVPVRDQALRLDTAASKSELAAHLVMLDEVSRRAARFDILHFHLDLLHLPLFERHAEKSVTTLHGRLDGKDLPQVFERWSSFGLVSISAAQRLPLAGANWLGTVPHGLPAERFAFTPRPAAGGYLAFLGRMSPEKGPETAIRLARRAGVPLKIAAKVDDVDRAYFHKVVEPLLRHPLIEFIGEIDELHKAEFLGNARALLFPIDWPEPFGIVMIEALACGTPVIANCCGSVPEVLQHGVTGLIVNSEEQALAAIARVGELDRRAVRAEFERRFTAESMARGYVDLYRRMLDSYRLGRAS